MTDGVLLRDCSDQCGLSVGDVTDGSDVDGRLSRDDLGVKRGNLLEVEVFECLWRQMSLGVDCLLLLSDDVFSSLTDEDELSLWLVSSFDLLCFLLVLDSRFVVLFLSFL